ncbi:diaminopimelate decarboxylase [Buchnera aphidicola (Thelaxes californica)]|uniref:Diaminopimelate decarboxylase n=1 Tax=Buchnera aphidicola (Thelaxes californica) TaxID=1315998 RepID=A0A4D6YCR2_9GAMM|nr:diaminopimelate decarboxylase [Buchnera aphidicola]QCI26862.1 diaminopimelate decarboxylase [Buchnera aphidicola (Thelaxes californica)]
MFNSFNYTFSYQDIYNFIKKNNTPFWVYDHNIIINKIQMLQKFDVIRFAQKACSNINILKIMKKNNVKIDAVSNGEIKRALFSGFHPDNGDIVFTSDILDNETLLTVTKFNIPVNIGSIDMIHKLGKVSPTHQIWLRINPGFGDGHNKKTNTGGDNSKHGILQPLLALNAIKKYNFQLIGIHMHIGSGVNYTHLKKVCKAMYQNVLKIKKNISHISAGGGLSIPYRKKDQQIDIEHYFQEWSNTKKKIEKYLKYPVTLEIEPGRFLVAESGILICTVYVIKKTNTHTFVLTDAGFNDLMRPVIYGSYHEISIIPHDHRIINTHNLIETVIGGPLCESGDIFTQNSKGDIITRKLPEIKIGDYLIFHQVGAYGSSMSSNYNSRPLISEFLFQNKKFMIIRRKQKIEDLIQLEIN